MGVSFYEDPTPNLGLGIAVSVREREQGRFRGSNEGARRRSEGAGGSNEGARGRSEGAGGSSEGAGGAPGEHRGAAREQRIWLLMLEGARHKGA